MNIKGLNKAEVLVALYNRAQPQGIGILVSAIVTDLSIEKSSRIN